MVSQPDARDLARHIVEAVLADHDARSAGVTPMPERPDTFAWQVAGRIVAEVLTAHEASGIAAQGPPPPPAAHERHVPAESAATGPPPIPEPAPEPEPVPAAEPELAPVAAPELEALPAVEPEPAPVAAPELEALSVLEAELEPAPLPEVEARMVSVAEPAPGPEDDSWPEPVEPRPRTGRWLLTTILAAIALALLLPLAIGAVRDLVALS